MVSPEWAVRYLRKGTRYLVGPGLDRGQELLLQGASTVERAVRSQHCPSLAPNPPLSVGGYQFLPQWAFENFKLY